MSTKVSLETARAMVIDDLARAKLADLQAEEDRQQAEEQAATAERERHERAAKLAEKEKALRDEIEKVGKANAAQVRALFDGFRKVEALVSDAEQVAVERRDLLGHAAHRAGDPLFTERHAFAKAARKAIIRDTLHDIDRLGFWFDRFLILSAQ